MAIIDFAPDFQLGEDVLKQAELRVVEYTDTIVAGDALKITGRTTDNQPKVAKQTVLTNARYIAMFPGVAGDFKQVLFKGETKLKAGAILASGVDFSISANTVIAGGSNPIKGFLIDAALTIGDSIIVYFDGSGGAH